MFNSSVLDIAIGLVLVYLLISIVLTSVSEAIEGVLKTRASDLERALGELFQGNNALLQSFYQHPLISGLYRGTYRDAGLPTAPTTTDADAPAPAANAPPPASSDAEGEFTPPTEGGHNNLPSYIPRETFSAAMMDLLDSEGGAKLKQAVQALANRHGMDLTAKRRAIEGWYDAAMDRASGRFKLRTQRRLFLLGLGIAVVGNVNSVTIAEYLASNQEAREGLVQMASTTRTEATPYVAPAAPKAGDGNAATANVTAANAAATNNSATAANTAGDAAATNSEAGNDAAPANMQAGGAGANSEPSAQARNDWLRDQAGRLRAIGLPIGWSDPVVALMGSGFPAAVPDTAANGQIWGFRARWAAALIILLAGYFATAFAVMLGSPFWFDLLGKLMVVRSTVKPRQKSPDEPPVDGPAPPPAPPPAEDGQAPQ